MRWSWFPWKFLVRRAARAHGFLDPIALLARLQRLAQPSEVSEPVELLRAGVLFHARGLINTRVIQHNLDWVWPYWIERQFDPHSDAFVPRAFSITHVNLTHRNWTAVGLPDRPELPIVDPRGLTTPFHDGWSLDGWVIGEDGARLYPSRAASASQWLDMGAGLAVVTATFDDGLRLEQRARMEQQADEAVLRITYTARAERGGQLAVALRPYNPEGISFVHGVAMDRNERRWLIDDHAQVRFGDPADAHFTSDYADGDVSIHLHDCKGQSADSCDVGLATAAALFRLAPGQQRAVTVSVPMGRRVDARPASDWNAALAGAARLQVPDARYQFLYDAALRTLLLHSVDDVYPGPFTYKRFWFRDAAFIVHALLAAGVTDRAERALARFPERQNPATGYFHSQEGEWDSNGQVLWIMARYAALTGRHLPVGWLRSLRKGARWIARKRTATVPDKPHAGLLPAGFSAEHLGPNDYYYWDDFWSVGGLWAAASLFEGQGDAHTAAWMRSEAQDFQRAIDRALARDERRLGRAAMPASPYRRMDAGAIGSLALGYPLQGCVADDARLLGTVNYLMSESRVHGGFFQDMIHSGVNAYLTLHLAQVLLRARDARCFELFDAVAQLASPTGQWPEAIHPRTRGGCMGDGQHVWAAADWVMMMRNCFLREEGDRLVLGAGIPSRWLDNGQRLAFGPAPTRFGTVSVEIGPGSAQGELDVRWQADWRERPETVEVGPVGAVAVEASPEARAVTLLAPRSNATFAS